MKTKEEIQPEKDEYLGRFPSEAEYIRRIDDISKAISNGEDAYIQTQNLLYDLPYKWLEEIEDDIALFELDYKTNIQKNIPNSQKLNYGRLYSLRVKQRIISFLEEVGMWSPKRQKAPEGSMSLYDREEEE